MSVSCVCLSEISLSISMSLERASQYCLDDGLKCITDGSEDQAYKVSVRKPEGKGPLRDLSIGVNIILK